MQSNAEIVITKLGGTRKAAALLNQAPSTVQSWKRVGIIPAKHQRDILDRAKEAGIALTAAELVEATPRPQPEQVA